jgi:hypothetical protein
MTVLMRCLFAVLFLFASAFTAHGQVKLPPETRNAALRYWQAFSEMKDPPADPETQAKMAKVLAGEQAWDEGKLGSLVDANEVALGIMQRSTKLSDCDWGIEYNQGYRASVAMVARANVLGRLNILQGIRQSAKGQTQAAAGIWIAGIRFAQDVSKGGSLLFALTAKTLLSQEMRAITVEAKQGRLNYPQKEQFRATVSALTEDGLDWALAWQLDEAGTDSLFTELQQSRQPADLYRRIMGEPVFRSCLPPNTQQLKAYRVYMNDVATALRLPPSTATQRLQELETEKKSICDTLLQSIPSAQRVNAARIEITSARKDLLDALAR